MDSLNFMPNNELSSGLNIIKVVSKDGAFATTALVTIEQVKPNIHYCKDIQFANTLGVINDAAKLKKYIVQYVNENICCPAS